jgi:segregation and condensation protein B
VSDAPEHDEDAPEHEEAVPTAEGAASAEHEVAVEPEDAPAEPEDAPAEVAPRRSDPASMNELARVVEALLFLSPEPVAVERIADACEVSEGEVVEALARLREHYAEGYRGVVLREVAGGFTLATDPVAEHAARRLLARPRTPPLSQAQAECLAIVAYLQPVSRPELARIRGVSSESAVATLLERGLIEESGRSRFGAVMYRTTQLFQKLFGLEALDALPDPARFDPSPEEEGELRERLLRAGEQRATSN